MVMVKVRLFPSVAEALEILTADFTFKVTVDVSQTPVFGAGKHTSTSKVSLPVYPGSGV